MEESIRRKNERYQIIKTGEKTLRQLTDSMEEVMSKTKAEIKAEVERLNTKDMLTTDNVLQSVKKHSDTVLFPRYCYAHFHCGLNSINSLFVDGCIAIEYRLETRFGGEEAEEEADDLLAKTAPAAMERGHSTRPHTTASSTSRKGGTLGRAQTAASPERTLHLKLFSKEALAESLDILKVTTAGSNYIYFTMLIT